MFHSDNKNKRCFTIPDQKLAAERFTLLCNTQNQKAFNLSPNRQNGIKWRVFVDRVCEIRLKPPSNQLEAHVNTLGTQITV